MTPELRVFISSTFHDLQAERDFLVKTVFPSVRHLCRERGVEFTEIDLRWGVTEEEAVRGRVIRSCLEEIEKCRPYFIGILGSRYGWAPLLHEVQKDAELVNRYPWIEDAVLEGQSVCELEFAHGLLHAPASDDSIVVYRRDPGGGPEADRVRNLHDRVAAHGVRTVPFATLEGLGDVIHQHLVAIVERDFPADAFSSDLHSARRGHDAFSAARRHGYIAEHAKLSRLSAHAEGHGPPLLVTAPSGFGKSALLAYWADWYSRKHPNAFLVRHFIGVGARAGDRVEVVRHCILEIKARLGIDDPLPDTAERLEAEFSDWLARIAPSGMVLVIDAIDQLAEGGAPSWLPAYVPEGVRLVVSCVPGPVADGLRDRGYAVMELEPLAEEQCEALIIRYLGEYRKALNPEQTRKIARDPKASVPLFVRTMLEELRLSGSFEQLDRNIDHFLAARDVADLFQRVLERIEGDFGADTVRRMLTAVWASRRGLLEEDIADFADISMSHLTVMLQALEYHMVRRHGLRTFFHEFLRSAVAARYLPTDEDKRAAHRQLAEHFTTHPLEKRPVDEEPWQWREAQEWDRLRHCLASMPMFARQYSRNAEHELLGYWLAIGDRCDMVAEYRQALERYVIRHPDGAGHARLCRDLGNFFTACSRYDAAEALLLRAHGAFLEMFGGDDLRTVDCLDDLAVALHFQGRYHEAEQAWRSALAVRERVQGPDAPALCETLDNITSVLYALGRNAEAESCARRSLEISERSYGPDNIETAKRVNNLASVLYALGRLEEALPAMERAVAINRAALGDVHPEVGRCLINLGSICERLGRLDDAVGHYSTSLAVLEHAYGARHDLIRVATSNLAHVLAQKGEFDRAHALYARALQAAEHVHGAAHVQAILIRLLTASVMRKEGRLHEAIAVYRQHLPEALRQGLEGPEVISHHRQFIEMLHEAGLGMEAQSWEDRMPESAHAASSAEE